MMLMAGGGASDFSFHLPMRGFFSCADAATARTIPRISIATPRREAFSRAAMFEDRFVMSVISDGKDTIIGHAPNSPGPADAAGFPFVRLRYVVGDCR